MPAVLAVTVCAMVATAMCTQHHTHWLTPQQAIVKTACVQT